MNTKISQITTSLLEFSEDQENLISKIDCLSNITTFTNDSTSIIGDLKNNNIGNKISENENYINLIKTNTNEIATQPIPAYKASIGKIENIDDSINLLDQSKLGEIYINYNIDEDVTLNIDNKK